MESMVDLKGNWEFRLDPEKTGLKGEFFRQAFDDTIHLPGTVSAARKSPPNDREETYFLTDPYLYEGFAWFARTLDLPDLTGKDVCLVLERTRTSHVWVDGVSAGTENSLCTSHRYNLSSLVKSGRQRLVILVDNTSCPVKGGHMTSQDTQTNWNGITGKIRLEVSATTRLENLQVYPDASARRAEIKAFLTGKTPARYQYRLADDTGSELASGSRDLVPGDNRFTLVMPETAPLWSEHSPRLLDLELVLETPAPALPPGQPVPACPETTRVRFGLRDFRAAGTHFAINGQKTFLRGKHDGLIFPLTGYAPTDLDSWMRVLSIAKEHGINHYRFHTCCPPEAAFEAADRLGIYMEPEVPFWGTVTVEGEENHDQAGQDYLIREGYRMLDEFANHPSFVMMSLGNELWGSKPRLNDILGAYKKHDPRPLYTQGCNNFQFWPDVLENDDFFCGVRLSKERLFRGSYAMCDAPQGHIQTAAPDISHNYDPLIRPGSTAGSGGEGGEITIQYGTGTKTVKAEASGEFIPKVPVVSHEIGQYCMYPDYNEIDKYTGVLKARSFEVFRRRLEAAGMLHKADAFFRASGRFAAECYKAEVETALRSRELAGFQLLDLQDFTGQGTALVGILNSLMESKGVMSPEEWHGFCADTVLLGEFGSFVVPGGQAKTLKVKLSRHAPGSLDKPVVTLTLSARASSSELPVWHQARLAVAGSLDQGVFDLGEFQVPLPPVAQPRILELELRLEGTDIRNHYQWWVYPADPEGRATPSALANPAPVAKSTPASPVPAGGTRPAATPSGAVWTETSSLDDACKALEAGRTVLYFPTNLTAENSIEGTYCTDFWNYPMFRSISESMKRPLPVGTLGLLVDHAHPALAGFATTDHSGPEWYDVVTASRALKLDGTPIEPLVWTIDNFERHHKLGTLFEVTVGKGRAVVCTANLPALSDSPAATCLLASLRTWLANPGPAPAAFLDSGAFRKLFGV